MNAFLKKYIGPSIRLKLILSFIAVMVPALVLGGYFGYRFVRNSLEDRVKSDLAALSESNKSRVEDFFLRAEGRVADFSSDGFIRDSVDALRVAEGADRQALERALSDHLVLNKQSLDPTIFGIHVFDAAGTIVGSTEESSVGLSAEGEFYFANVLGSPYGTADVTDAIEDCYFGCGKSLLVASASLTDKTKRESFGVISNFVSLEYLNDVVSSGREYEPGALSSNGDAVSTIDVYIANADGAILTDSLYGSSETLSKVVNAEALASSCV